MYPIAHVPHHPCQPSRSMHYYGNVKEVLASLEADPDRMDVVRMGFERNAHYMM